MGEEEQFLDQFWYIYACMYVYIFCCFTREINKGKLSLDIKFLLHGLVHGGKMFP